MKTATEKVGSRTWVQMGIAEKSFFLAKIVVMVCTFGFVYGNILTP